MIIIHHRNGALRNRISALIKVASFYHVKIQGKGSLCEPGSGSFPDTESVDALTLDMFSAFRMVRNKLLLFISTLTMVVCYSGPMEQDKYLTEKKMI